MNGSWDKEEQNTNFKKKKCIDWLCCVLPRCLNDLKWTMQ